MKLYTRTGDDGSTALFGGRRVAKDDPRVTAYGEVDELNAAIGLTMAAVGAGASAIPLGQRLAQLQSELFELGADLATPSDSPQRATVPTAAVDSITRLEQWIDEAQAAVAPMKHFVLPGGCELACRLHLARTICRRAERAVVRLARDETVSPLVIVYLNRVSDLLFAWSRWANHEAGIADVPWIPPHRPTP